MLDKKHILVIDDDTRIRNLLSKYLREHHFIVSMAQDAAQARYMMTRFIFDLLIVDIMMPGESGIELTQSLQHKIAPPVLMLTAMGETEDRIDGLQSGADDYLPKPFDPKELLLRINNILRRIQKKPQDILDKIIEFGPFIFSLSTLTLTKKGHIVSLTTNELQLLKILSEKQGRIFSREKLSKLSDHINVRSIDVQIKRLRTKIETNPKNPMYLKTVRGQGYVFYAVKN